MLFLNVLKPWKRWPFDGFHGFSLSNSITFRSHSRLHFRIRFFIDFSHVLASILVPFELLLGPLASPISTLGPKSMLGCILVAFWLTLGSLWAPFGSLLAPFGTLWLSFGSLLAPFGSLWLPLGSLLLPFGSLWLPLGSLLLHLCHFGSLSAPLWRRNTPATLKYVLKHVLTLF